MSMTHFSIAGCFSNKLDDDLVEAQEEIQSLALASNNDWKFEFDPREHELPEHSCDYERSRLPDDELEELGSKVVQLRE